MATKSPARRRAARPREETEGLTPKRLLFVEEYLQDLNGAAAYRRAGYTAANNHVAAVEAHKLLQLPPVKEAIALRLEERLEAAGIHSARILEELGAVALTPLTELLEWDGAGVHIRASGELTPAAAASLQSIKCKETRVATDDGAELIKTEWELKQHPKVQALEMLMKHKRLLGNDEDDGRQLHVHYYVEIPKPLSRDEWAREYAAQRSLPGAPAGRALPATTARVKP